MTLIRTYSLRKVFLFTISVSVFLYTLLYVVLNLPPSLFIPQAPESIQRYSSVPMSLRVLHDGEHSITTRVFLNAWAFSQNSPAGLRPLMFTLGLAYYPYRLTTDPAFTIVISDRGQTYSLITLQTHIVLHEYHLPPTSWAPDLTPIRPSTDVARLTLDHVLLHEIGHTLSLRYTQYKLEDTVQVEGFADLFSLWVLAQQGSIHLRHPLFDQLIYYRIHSSSPLYSVDPILRFQLRWIQHPTSLFSAQLQSTSIQTLDNLWIMAEPVK